MLKPWQGSGAQVSRFNHDHVPNGDFVRFCHTVDGRKVVLDYIDAAWIAPNGIHVSMIPFRFFAAPEWFWVNRGRSAQHVVFAPISRLWNLQVFLRFTVPYHLYDCDLCRARWSERSDAIWTCDTDHFRLTCVQCGPRHPPGACAFAGGAPAAGVNREQEYFHNYSILRARFDPDGRWSDPRATMAPAPPANMRLDSMTMSRF